MSQRMRPTVAPDAGVFNPAPVPTPVPNKRLREGILLQARRSFQSSKNAYRTKLPGFEVRRDAAIIPSRRAQELLAEETT